MKRLHRNTWQEGEPPDGGKLIFLIYEAIKGKPVNSRIEGTIQLAGMGLLLMLFAAIMYTH